MEYDSVLEIHQCISNGIVIALILVGLYLLKQQIQQKEINSIDLSLFL